MANNQKKRTQYVDVASSAGVKQAPNGALAKSVSSMKDYTAQPQAQTAKDVQGQDRATRLWQSLDYSYNRQRQDSDKAYDRAITENSNSMLSRGLNRSTYASQLESNLANEKVKANNDITSAQIADFQNRLTQLEQQDFENELAQRQFDEGVRQFDEGQKLTREESEKARQFQSKESQLDREAQRTLQELQQKWQSGESKLSREQEKTLQLLQQEFQSKESALSRAEQARQFDESMGQQKYEFSETTKDRRQSTMQSIVTAMIQSGVVPSQEMLEAAGISGEDATAWVQKLEAGTSGSSSGKNPPPTTGGGEDEGTSFWDLVKAMKKTGTSFGGVSGSVGTAVTKTQTKDKLK